MRQIVLDTETTGLDPNMGHRIVEIGCLELINHRVSKNSFHVYLNPEREIDHAALAVHGISEQFLQDKPVFNAVAEKLLAYIKGAELVIHNAAFDLSFLDAEFSRYFRKQFKLAQLCNVVDTLTLARKKHPGQRNSLDALCKRYNIDNSNREYHGALLDARLLVGVYLQLTGGQAELFNDTDMLHAEVQQNKQKRRKKLSTELVVIKANQEELIEHKQYLARLRETSKQQCVWDTLENNPKFGS